MADVVMIRPLHATDRSQWETLWRGYLDFYRADLPVEVTERTWAALCEDTSAVHGLVAEADGELAGLAHTVLHPTTWATGPACCRSPLYARRPRQELPARSRSESPAAPHVAEPHRKAKGRVTDESA